MWLSNQLHKRITWLGLLLLVVGLPLSKFLMSVSQFVLLGSWLLSGSLNQKVKDILNNTYSPWLIGLFLIHIIGLLWTTDYSYAFSDIRIKLPLLLLPIVLSDKTLQWTKKDFKGWLMAFVFATLIGTCCSLYYYHQHANEVTFDIREISIFISHIRFSLIVNVAIFVTFYLAQNAVNTKVKYIWLGLACWLIVFLFILESLTGIIAFVITLVISLFAWQVPARIKWLKWSLGAMVILLLLTTSFLLVGMVQKQFNHHQEDLTQLAYRTANGDLYYHDASSQIRENGYLVNVYICKSELEMEWSNLSSIPFDSLDGKGQPIYATLVRFLASKGLRKDKEGISALSKKEIQAIEDGIPNVDYMNLGGIRLRLRETLWELDNYFAGGNPSGNTLTQRLEFWKTGWDIVRNNWIIGVGTGDVKMEFNKQYEKNDSILDPAFRKRTHNQYLTVWITFGIFGILYFLWMLLYFFYRSSFHSNKLMMILLITATLSFLNEDTLETQAGVTFFVGLLGLFSLKPKSS